MIFTNLEKYVFQKVLKTTTSTPHPSIQQSRRYFRAESVTWLRLRIGGRPEPISNRLCDWLGKQWGW